MLICRYFENKSEAMIHCNKPTLFASALAAFVVCGKAHPAETHAAVAQRGIAAYYAYCAKCHDSGDGNAPLLADKSAWSHRSLDWEAILKDHVNQGFLTMPAKGGKTTLTAESAGAAVELMEWELRNHSLNFNAK